MIGTEAELSILRSRGNKGQRRRGRGWSSESMELKRDGRKVDDGEEKVITNTIDEPFCGKA